MRFTGKMLIMLVGLPPVKEEVMPMVFLADVLAAFVAAVLAGLVLRLIDRH